MKIRHAPKIVYILPPIAAFCVTLAIFQISARPAHVSDGVAKDQSSGMTFKNANRDFDVRFIPSDAAMGTVCILATANSSITTGEMSCVQYSGVVDMDTTQLTVLSERIVPNVNAPDLSVVEFSPGRTDIICIHAMQTQKTSSAHFDCTIR